MASKRIKNDLECPVCMDMFKSPKLLSCVHTFCEDCLRKLVTSKNNVKTISCPTCRAVTTINNDVSSLHVNFIVQHVLESLEIKDERKNNNFICSECEEDKAIFFCKECNLKLCDICSNYHSRNIKFKHHQIVGINVIPDNSLRSSAVKYCSKHKEIFKYFCTQCQVLVCCDCTMSKLHAGHQFGLIDEVAGDHRKKLNNVIEDTKRKQALLNDNVCESKEFLVSIKDARDASRTVLDITFKKIITALETKKLQLVKSLDENYNKSVKEVQALKERSTCMSDVLRFAEKTFKEADSMDLMNIYGNIALRCNDLTSNTPSCYSVPTYAGPFTFGKVHTQVRKGDICGLFVSEKIGQQRATVFQRYAPSTGNKNMLLQRISVNEPLLNDFLSSVTKICSGDIET